MIKALTATGWGKQKETLMATYKAVMRPALEYACCCSPSKTRRLESLEHFNVLYFIYFFLRGRFIETNKNYIQDSRGEKTLDIQ